MSDPSISRLLRSGVWDNVFSLAILSELECVVVTHCGVLSCKVVQRNMVRHVCVQYLGGGCLFLFLVARET